MFMWKVQLPYFSEMNHTQSYPRKCPKGPYWLCNHLGTLMFFSPQCLMLSSLSLSLSVFRWTKALFFLSSVISSFLPHFTPSFSLYSSSYNGVQQFTPSLPLLSISLSFFLLLSLRFLFWLSRSCFCTLKAIRASGWWRIEGRGRRERWHLTRRWWRRGEKTFFDRVFSRFKQQVRGRLRWKLPIGVYGFR